MTDREKPPAHETDSERLAAERAARINALFKSPRQEDKAQAAALLARSMTKKEQ